MELSQARPTLTLRWSRCDSVAICGLLIAAAVAYFWRIGVPDALVYNESIFVEKAYRYLHGEQFVDMHPPLPSLMIAASLRLFGCQPWCWRIASAATGTILIPITYLLGRRLFNSRLAGALAAVLVLCDGMFLEFSRLGLFNIVYVTLGAAAYLALFRFVQTDDLAKRRRTLVVMGVLLGLAMGAKQVIPEVTWMLTVGFLVLWTIWDRINANEDRRQLARYLTGVIATIGSLSAVFYLAAYLPNYWFGWWRNVGDIVDYYHNVVRLNVTYRPLGRHEESPWWSWPLMLHPYRYWAGPSEQGGFSEIWGGGNPAIWWAALMAIALAAVRAIRREAPAWSFLVVGYLAYLIMWIPIPRVLYLYSYLPALYLAMLALGGLLDLCWRGSARVFEQVALLMPVFVVWLLGLGPAAGTVACALALIAYGVAWFKGQWAGKFVCSLVVATAIVAFFYFLPLWVAAPVSENQIADRMWLTGTGIANWTFR